MKIVAVIPAHMASVRFPRKILFQFHGLPMIEHVRRRALLSQAFDEVYVATCDEEIASAIRSFGGKVIMTANTHTNGTSRVAEAVTTIDCTHVVLLQGDEPLLLPNHVIKLVEAIKQNPEGESWNATGPIDHFEELDKHSFVKCAVAESGRIIFCFRRSPGYSEFEIQRIFIRKILGLIAFRKDFLKKIVDLPVSRIEQYESIEQMRVIENGYTMVSVPVNPSLPSVNEPEEAHIIQDYLKGNREQEQLLNEILKESTNFIQ
jgi:3-deoxy-manno-octulosonate cytidylyltransferase (CMP-KDO synthetase)